MGSILAKMCKTAVRYILVSVITLSLLLCCAACASDKNANLSHKSSSNISKEPVIVSSLKGATSIGLAAMIQEQDSSYEFQISTNADEIVPKLSSGSVDIALIPANLAAVLYKKTNGGIQVIDVNTLGVLYGITANTSLKEMSDVSISDLVGKTIYMTGKGTVPEYTLRCLIQAAGISESNVAIEFRSEPTEVLAMLEANPDSVGIVPQPFATTAVLKNENLKNVLDLNEQWNILATKQNSSINNGGKMVTGVTVARTDFIKERPEAIKSFLEAHKQSATLAASDPKAVAEEVVQLGIVPNINIAEIAIPLCNIVCLTSTEMKEALSGYLEALYFMSPEAIGNSLPGDDFYYIS